LDEEGVDVLKRFRRDRARERDRALVHAMRTGDERAASELYSCYWPRCERFHRGRCRQTEVADDLAAETMARVVDKIMRGGIADPSALTEFTSTTARFVWFQHLDRMRRERNLLIFVDPDELPDCRGATTERSPLDWILGRETRGLVRRALAELAATDRRILELRLRDGLAYEAIAGRLRISTACARQRLRRARGRLRRRFEHLADG
jgi:RNA polymerase sigma factor (sigma-70 family)